jgi:membrane fusion protein, heavy metal efflux system
MSAPSSVSSLALPRRLLLWWSPLLLAITHVGIAAENNSKAAAMPAVAQTTTISEAQLNQVSLPFETIRKLGISSSKVTAASVQPYQSYPAEVSVPPAALAAYSTPVSGTVQPAPGLHIGSKVQAGQRLFTITPIVTPETRLNLMTSLADVSGQQQAAEKQLAAHTLTLNRTSQLQAERVGSQKAVDEAQANVVLAQANLHAIQQKRHLLQQAVEQGATGTYYVTAAGPGLLSNLYFSPGQLLVAGARLADVVDQQTLWVTVSLPHAHLSRLNLAADAWLDQQPGDSLAAYSLAAYSLKPVASMPEGDLLSGTRKLVYAVQAQGNIVPMQRLTVQLPLRHNARPRLSLPCSATIVDIYGNTWVYVQQQATQFTRQPVFISLSTAQGCVLSDQRLAGKTVVTQGAQELFAIETGYTH